MKPLYLYISKPSLENVLHVMDLPTVGKAVTPVISVDGFRAYLAEHPEVQKVNFYFYANGIPRRAVPVEKVTDTLLCRVFKLMA